MSEIIKKETKKNPDSDKWKGVETDTYIQQYNDSAKNAMLSSALKENVKKQQQKKEENIFAAKAKVLQSYGYGQANNETKSDQEIFEEKQAAKENYEKYGEGLTSEAAKRCFSKEYIALKNRFSKVKLAEEKEKDMSPKNRQKSYKKRVKEGITMTEEDRKHLFEMDSMNTYQREEYGRKKRREYRQAQEMLKAHPFKTRQLLRKHKLLIPKEWDDPNCSLNQLKQINSLFILLREDKK